MRRRILLVAAMLLVVAIDIVGAFWRHDHPAWAQDRLGAYSPSGREVVSGTTDNARVTDFEGGIFWKSAATSGKTETLPACTLGLNGAWITVIDEEGNASQYNITVNAASGTVGGQSLGVPITSNYGADIFKCDGAATNWAIKATYAPGTNVRQVATTADTILATDNGGEVTYNSAAAVSVNLPQAGSIGFPDNAFTVRLANYGAGALQITPQGGSTISYGAVVGGTSLTLAQGQSAVIVLGGSGNYSALLIGNPGQVVVFLANAATTGTTLNALAKLTGAPATAIVAATTDTAGIEGIVVAGAGTSGNALIARAGQTSCIFDGATTAGDWVQISVTTGGDCHDAGASYPSSGQVIGRVLSTNASGGTYPVNLSGSYAQASNGGNMVGSGSTTSGNLLQSNNTGATLDTAFDSGIAASNVDTLSGTQTITGNKTFTGNETFGTLQGAIDNTPTTSPYTFVAGDCGKTVLVSNGSTAVTETIPASIAPGSTVACVISVIQGGTAKVSVNGTAVSAATLVSAHSYTGTSGTQGSEITLTITTVNATTTAFLTGDGS
jgi:hypothetical protein